MSIFSIDVHRDTHALDRNVTNRIDLPTKGILSSLYLRFSVTPVSGAFAGTGKWRLLDYLDQIRIIANGSDVLVDATAEELAAFAFFDQGAPVTDMWRNYATNTFFCNVLINFGRYMKDAEYALDLSMFSTLVLEIKNTLTSSLASDSLTVDIILIRAKVPFEFHPKGFITKEIYREYTTVQNGYEYYELPVDPPLRGVYTWVVPDLDSTTHIDEISGFSALRNVKMTLNGGAVLLVDGLSQILAEIDWYERIGFRLNRGMWYGTKERGVPCSFLRPIGWAVSASTDAAGDADTVPSIEKDNTASRLNFRSYTADEPTNFLVTGLAYGQTFPIYRARTLETSDLLVASYAPVDLELYTYNDSAAPDGTVRVLLERLRTRPAR